MTIKLENGFSSTNFSLKSKYRQWIYRSIYKPTAVDPLIVAGEIVCQTITR